MMRTPNSLYVNTPKRGKKEARTSLAAACLFDCWHRLADGYFARIFGGLAVDEPLATEDVCPRFWACFG
jgi:hypothetical protein